MADGTGMPLPLRGLPFLKWTGGKRWLAATIASLLPRRYNRYLEPFLGGGAVFFHVRPWPASLSDNNADLINTYIQVRDNVEEIIRQLSRLHICPKFYLKTRAASVHENMSRAVRFLYLNRTAFNGIYRVNREGHFNVPFGCKEGTVLCDEKLLRNASKALQKRQIFTADFEQAIRQAKAGDLVYADPPYTTKHNNNGFRRYNEVIFSWNDQERLAECCHLAVARGAHVFVSNANHKPIIELYEGFSVKDISRKSLISGDAHFRGDVTECLLYRLTGTAGTVSDRRPI